ncbi:MAG TPA: hypothetical protein VNK70_01415 [Candidatus Paceibacterota bacterium]|nr:hypothetical protein [Candidatus Paceibacterota bacterium]
MNPERFENTPVPPENEGTLKPEDKKVADTRPEEAITQEQIEAAPTAESPAMPETLTPPETPPAGTPSTTPEEAEKIKAGHPIEMPAVKIEGAEEKPKEAQKQHGRIWKFMRALGAGVEGAKEGWREKRTERKTKAEEKKEAKRKAKNNREIEKEVKKIEKVKGKEAAEEARKIKKGEVIIAKKFEAKQEKKDIKKTWDEMTEEERREKYGRTFETREKLHQLNKTRANLVVLENLFRNYPKSEKIKGEYEAALKEYERVRAEYIGAKSWRMLKERKRMAEEESAKYVERSKFEKFRKAWRWLGDQNLEKLLPKKFEPKSRFTKFAVRMMSLRTLVSLGLLGGGMAIGFGSAVGIGMVAARRVMGGLGTAFGSYDLMRMAVEKKALALTEEKIEEMDMPEIEQKMAEFEARAKFSGERIVRSKEYLLLRQRYNKMFGLTEDRDINVITEEKKGFTPESARKERLAKAIQTLDSSLREKQEKVTKEEKHRKVAAVGVGLVSVGVFSASDIKQIFQEKPEFAGITPEQVRDTVERGPIATPEQIQDTVRTETALPDSVTEEAAQDTLRRVGGGVTAEAATRTATEAPAAEIIAGTVRQGGSAWQAAYELVRSGRLTETQFAEAWSNHASVVELASGTRVHISELGLTHAGDQVVYVAAEGNVPAHFEVVDFVGDRFHVGSNADLAEAFRAEGKQVPAWLREALGETAPVPEAPDVPTIEIPENVLRETQADIARATNELTRQATEGGIVPPAEVAQRAAEHALETAPEQINFDWGTARFILDTEGRIADITIEETVTPEMRTTYIGQAIMDHLNPNYRRVLESGVPEETRHIIMPSRIARAEEAAWEVDRLMRVLERFPDRYSSQSYFLRFKIQTLARAREMALGARIFRTFRF